MLNYILLQSAAGEGGGAGLMNIIMIVALVAIFWLFMIRPQQKRQKEIRQFRESLTKGSRVLTGGGIYGTIVAVKDTYFVVEIAKGVHVDIDKGSVFKGGTSAEEMKEANGADNK